MTNVQLAHVAYKEPELRALLVDFGVDVEKWKPKDRSMFLLFFRQLFIVAVAAAFFAVAVSHRSNSLSAARSHPAVIFFPQPFSPGAVFLAAVAAISSLAVSHCSHSLSAALCTWRRFSYSRCSHFFT